MSIGKYYIVLILLLLSSLGEGIVRAQGLRSEFNVDFRVNITTVDTLYSDNSSNLRELRSFLRRVRSDSTINITSVSFCGAASPEGSYQLNRRLARGRLTALENIVRSELQIPDSLIVRDDSYIPWDYLKARVSESDLLRKDEILSVLNEEASLVDYHRPNAHIDGRIEKLRDLDSDTTWRALHKQFFADMRNASVVLVTYRWGGEPLSRLEVLTPTLLPLPESSGKLACKEQRVSVTDTTATRDSSFSSPSSWTRRLHLKTNAAGWALAMANGAVEIDLCKHLSLALPVHYSAWNYFSETLKFRTLSVQPELRYWLSPDNSGFYAGAHFGLAYYNFAFDGAYRYQDHNGTTPALGGGLSVGYRLPLTKNARWNMEFAIGAGAYSLHYDRFHNTPATKYGLLIDSINDTYIGIDQAAVSFSYAFGLNRKGGRK